jgi:hypothetical protein
MVIPMSILLAEAKMADDERQIPLKEETLEDKNKQLNSKTEVEERSKQKILALTKARNTEQ